MVHRYISNNTASSVKSFSSHNEKRGNRTTMSDFLSFLCGHFRPVDDRDEPPELFEPKLEERADQENRQHRSEEDGAAEHPADEAGRQFHPRPHHADRRVESIGQGERQPVPWAGPITDGDVQTSTHPDDEDAEDEPGDVERDAVELRQPMLVENQVHEHADEDGIDERPELGPNPVQYVLAEDEQKTDEQDDRPDGNRGVPGEPEMEHVPCRHAEVGRDHHRRSEGEQEQTAHE